MRLRSSLLIFGLAGILSVTGVAAYANANSANNFVRKASIANKFEIDSSQLALSKSQNNDVKEFAQHMIDDHTKIGGKLQETLQSSNSPLQPEKQLDSKHQHLMDKLQNASIDDFDHQYISMQTNAHVQAVKLFSNYARHGDDKALRKFASDTLPTLQIHLQQAQQLNVNVNIPASR